MSEYRPGEYHAPPWGAMSEEQREKVRRGKKSHWVSERKKRVFLITYAIPKNKGNRFVAMAKAGIKDEQTIANWVKADERFAEEYVALQDAWAADYAEQVRDIIPDAIEAKREMVTQRKDLRTADKAATDVLEHFKLLRRGKQEEGPRVGDMTQPIIITMVQVTEASPKSAIGEGEKRKGEIIEGERVST